MEKKDNIRNRKRIFAGAAVLILLLSALPFSRLLLERLNAAAGLQPILRQEKNYPLNLYFLDVGKADAIVLECDGEYALLDAGTFTGGEDVEIALKKLGVKKLKYVFATHPDSDHIGGMGQILTDFPVQTLICADTPQALLPNSKEYAVMQAAVEGKQIPVTIAAVNDVYPLGSAEISVLGPIGEHEDVNNYSLVLKLTLNDFSCLLMGDAEERLEQMLCDCGADLRADVLKVGHHGSKTSTSERLLNAVQPKYAVISTGPDKNNLPKKSVLKRLAAANIETYRTDTDGIVLVSSDGAEIAIKTER